MKTPFQKINDSAFSNLLRAQFGRPSASPSACPEFDPDLANAYVEHSLTPVMRTRYERHLSECAGCRTSVVALSRMAEADSIPLHVLDNAAARSGEPGWLASIKGGFSALASPRWTAVAAALVIIAFSIPVLVWQSTRSGTSESEPTASLPAQDRPEPAAESPSQSARGLSGDTVDSLSLRQDAGRASSQSKAPPAISKASGSPQSATAAASLKKQTNEQTSGQGGQTVAESSDRKADVGNLTAAADETRSKVQGEKQVAGASAQAPPTRGRTEESTVLSKISKEEALKLPAEDKNSVSVTGLKAGVVDAVPRTERERAATITARDGEAPKTKGAEGVSRGAIISRRPGSRALLDGDTAREDRPRSPQKKVGKKTFLLSKGIWTDSDYDPTDDLPIVTVVRSSDVYREMLEKNNKLRSFLTGFVEGERAIIVYKSTVYKLIPHSDSK